MTDLHVASHVNIFSICVNYYNAIISVSYRIQVGPLNVPGSKRRLLISLPTYPVDVGIPVASILARLPCRGSLA